MGKSENNTLDAVASQDRMPQLISAATLIEQPESMIIARGVKRAKISNHAIIKIMANIPERIRPTAHTRGIVDAVGKVHKNEPSITRTADRVTMLLFPIIGGKRREKKRLARHTMSPGSIDIGAVWMALRLSNMGAIKRMTAQAHMHAYPTA